MILKKWVGELFPKSAERSGLSTKTGVFLGRPNNSAKLVPFGAFGGRIDAVLTKANPYRMDLIATAKFFAKNPIPALSEDEEQDAIEAARHGDSDSLQALVASYCFLVLKHWDGTEDGSSVLGLAFWEAICDFDPARAPRLGGVLKMKILSENYHAGPDVSSISVPAETVKLYKRVMAQVDGDFAEGMDVCKTFGMTRRRFLAAHDALHFGRVVTLQEWDDIAVEDDWEEMTAVALDAVEGKEAVVISRAFGFETVVVDGVEFTPRGHAPLSDRLVGASMNLSRSRVQKLKSNALDRMRFALSEVYDYDFPGLEVTPDVAA